MTSFTKGLGAPMGIPLKVSLSLVFLQASGILDTMALITPTSVVRILWRIGYLGNRK